MHIQHVWQQYGPKGLMHGPSMLFALVDLVCGAGHQACLLLLETVCMMYVAPAIGCSESKSAGVHV